MCIFTWINTWFVDRVAPWATITLRTTTRRIWFFYIFGFSSIGISAPAFSAILKTKISVVLASTIATWFIVAIAFVYGKVSVSVISITSNVNWNISITAWRDWTFIKWIMRKFSKFLFVTGAISIYVCKYLYQQFFLHRWTYI